MNTAEENIALLNVIVNGIIDRAWLASRHSRDPEAGEVRFNMESGEEISELDIPLN